MKTCTKFLFFAAMASVISISASAQSYLEDPRYGNSPEERQANALTLNYFNDNYKNNNIGEAVKNLQELMVKAPKSSENMYINGVNIYRNKIARATSVAEKKVMLDSLMLLYDNRIESFSDHPTRGRNFLLGLKARDYVSNNPADKEGVRRLFTEAINANGDDADPELINIYFNALVEDYKADAIETNILLDEYDRLANILSKSNAEGVAEAKEVFDALFVSSKAASCENLEKIFAKVLEAPVDAVLTEKAFNLLSRNNCSSPFQIAVAEQFYKIKPSSAVALSLAAGFEAAGEYARARTYLNEAIASETAPDLKANLAIRIAAGELAQNNYRVAAEFARQAIDIDPTNGYAYMILGSAYASGASACADFNRQTVYWLATDALVKARDLMSKDDNQLKNVESQIASFRAAFPSNEDCFFRGLDNGASYRVNCGWISGSTIVRTNK